MKPQKGISKNVPNHRAVLYKNTSKKVVVKTKTKRKQAPLYTKSSINDVTEDYTSIEYEGNEFCFTD